MTVVRRSVTAHVRTGASEGSQFLQVRKLYPNLEWSSGDPLAVRIDVVEPGRANPWLIGRDLLALSLRGPVGEGDVRCAPEDFMGEASVRFEMTGDTCGGRHRERGVLWMPREQLAGFLDETYQYVPIGGEAIDVDSFLTELLSEETR